VSLPFDYCVKYLSTCHRCFSWKLFFLSPLSIVCCSHHCDHSYMPGMMLFPLTLLYKIFPLPLYHCAFTWLLPSPRLIVAFEPFSLSATVAVTACCTICLQQNASSACACFSHGSIDSLSKNIPTRLLLLLPLAAQQHLLPFTNTAVTPAPVLALLAVLVVSCCCAAVNFSDQ